MEPIDGAAIHERRKFAESISEGVSDGTHGQDDVQLVTNAVDEEVEQRGRRTVSLTRLVAHSRNGKKGHCDEMQEAVVKRCNH